MGKKDALKAYNSVNVSSNVAYADQVQLIQMLFDGLIESLDKAVGHIHRIGRAVPACHASSRGGPPVRAVPERVHPHASRRELRVPVDRRSI